MRSRANVSMLDVARPSLAPIVAALLVLAGSAGAAGADNPRFAEKRQAASGSVPAVLSESAGAAADFPGGMATGDAVRVVFRSYEVASIGAELNARITYLPSREGDRIRKGEPIVEFDCSRFAAEHDAAQATYNASRAVYETQLQLMRYQAAGTLPVEQAKFEMQKAEAEARALKVRRDSCIVPAPFDGRVVEKSAQVHEIAQPNQPLLRIVNEAKLELVLMVPSSWLPQISEGRRFKVRVDENGVTYEARILQSTGLIDPVSQSARLIGELVAPASGIAPGMSGTAYFEDAEARNDH